MKIKVHIFADEVYGCFYGISKYNEATEVWDEFEHEKFITQQIALGRVKDAKDIRSRIELMTTEIGLAEMNFRNEGSKQRGPLLAIPGKAYKGKLRLYAYRYSDSFGLLGGGCFKPDKGYAKRKLDDHEDCKEAADFLAAVYHALKAKVKTHSIEIKDDGFYSNLGLEDEIELEI